MALRRMFLASVFFLTTTMLSFGLYNVTARAINAVNDGVSAGSTPDGGFWDNPYTRFVPSSYEPAIVIAMDLGLSVMVSCGLFYSAGYARSHWALRRTRLRHPR